MALNIISKQMANTAESYAEVVEIITNAFEWDEIVTNADPVSTDFRKYTDNTHTTYAGIRFVQQNGINGGHYFNAIGNNGTADAEAAFVPQNFNGDRYARWVFINIVSGPDYICLHGTQGGMPYGAPVHINVGLSKSTNLLTGQAGYASWLGYIDDSTSVINNYYLAVLGAALIGNTAHHYHAENNGRLMAVQKLVTPTSVDVPDGPLLIQTTTESHFNSAGYCTFGGKKYYKNGCILLPAE